MTGAMLIYVRDTAFDASDGKELIELYEKMLLKMNHKLDPMSYSMITIACSRQYESIEESIKFLEEAKDRLKNKQDAIKMLEIS